jgi:hypothetical protein
MNIEDWEKAKLTEQPAQPVEFPYSKEIEEAKKWLGNRYLLAEPINA